MSVVREAIKKKTFRAWIPDGVTAQGKILTECVRFSDVVKAMENE